MRSGNIKLAYKTIRTSRWQSMMTMFGIVVGIVSVVTTISLGEGIKRQILGEVNKLGGNLITVRAGKAVQRDDKGNITKVNPDFLYGFGSGSLSEKDVTVVQSVSNLQDSSPVRLLYGSLKAANNEYSDGFVLGTSSTMPKLIDQKVEYGAYFGGGEDSRQVAVIGKRIAENLFKENVPIGQSITIRGQDFVVRGVFEEFNNNILGQGIDLNNAVFVPKDSLKQLAGDAAPVVRVLGTAKPDKDVKAVAKEIEKALTQSHDGQNDFSVIRQDENLEITGGVLNVLTGFIGAIAAISLLVGGIGIMNIMLVSVSERTHEIGIRKAVGATNSQIRKQFLSEAVVLSFLGGIAGVVLSFLVNFLIRVTTDLQPFITWPVVAIAAGVAIAVGIVFGTIPAIKAARKDPIEALRISN